ncbi:hypothetical protein HMPREF1565_1626 [Providencia alcalifaciens RIMD 1656011]|nr:hypothetical protein HMPREF1565_1626 [Providencia alcalifaciens RIMD 1656011]
MEKITSFADILSGSANVCDSFLTEIFEAINCDIVMQSA